MRIRDTRNYLHKLIVVNVSSSPAALPGNVYDRWLARLWPLARKSVSFIFAILAYVYTVVPLYSRALLEEQIAKKELELIAKEKSIAVLQVDIGDREKRIVELSTAIAAETSRLTSLEAQVRRSREQAIEAGVAKLRAENAKMVAENEARASTVLAGRTYASLRVTALALMIDRAYPSCAVPILNASTASMRGIKELPSFATNAHCFSRRVSTDAAFSSLNAEDRARVIRSIEAIEESAGAELRTIDSRIQEIQQRYVRELENSAMLAKEEAKSKDVYKGMERITRDYRIQNREAGEIGEQLQAALRVFGQVAENAKLIFSPGGDEAPHK